MKHHPRGRGALHPHPSAAAQSAAGCDGIEGCPAARLVRRIVRAFRLRHRRLQAALQHVAGGDDAAGAVGLCQRIHVSAGPCARQCRLHREAVRARDAAIRSFRRHGGAGACLRRLPPERAARGRGGLLRRYRLHQIGDLKLCHTRLAVRCRHRPGQPARLFSDAPERSGDRGSRQDHASGICGAAGPPALRSRSRTRSMRGPSRR